jgi:hypothetical protein
LPGIPPPARDGEFLTSLLGVIAKTFYESYEAISFNKNIAACCDEEKTRSSLRERKPGDLITWCEAADVCARGTIKPTTPKLPPLLVLLFLPVAAGWVVVYFVVSAIKWVREGFKPK